MFMNMIFCFLDKLVVPFVALSASHLECLLVAGYVPFSFDI